MLRRIVLITCLCASVAITAKAQDDAQTRDTTIYVPADTLYFEDGGWYVGQIADSLFEGAGIMQYADGTRYEGQWSKGMWNGSGRIDFPDGDYYEGSFKNHQMDGKGVYSYSNGAVYTGAFKDSKFDGFGYMNFADGGYYAGNFKDDMKHGSGLLLDATDSTYYRGYFYKDSYIGNDRESFEFYEKNDAAFQSDYIYDGYADYMGWEFDKDLYFGLDLGFTFRDWLLAAFNVYNNDQSWGLEIGLNGAPPFHGISTEVYNDDGDLVEDGAGWDCYKDDEISEGDYTMATIDLNFGYRMGEYFYVSYGVGIGFDMYYKNCQVKGTAGSCPWYDNGTWYHKEKFKGVSFDYGTELKFLRPFPKDLEDDLTLCLNAAWHRISGFGVGIGIMF